ncbi:hypothetical protein AAFF_G00398550 [Aldrovandia affinis]|uniref:Secreted protein n=1 Tax=Aldrovandia affinis TaxID=143900 RepID=A0AAD7SF07_9TELE|nr:hypothetical protein AAFF_G00398550 [Aldrovandia affinis]
MHPPLLLITIASLSLGIKLPDVVLPGPKAGILLKDDPGFLVVDAQTVTHQVYVSLDPLHVIHTTTTRCNKVPQHIYREETRTWYQEHLPHTRVGCQNYSAAAGANSLIHRHT